MNHNNNKCSKNKCLEKKSENGPLSCYVPQVLDFLLTRIRNMKKGNDAFTQLLSWPGNFLRFTGNGQNKQNLWKLMYYIPYWFTSIVALGTSADPETLERGGGSKKHEI